MDAWYAAEDGHGGVAFDDAFGFGAAAIVEHDAEQGDVALSEGFQGKEAVVDAAEVGGDDKDGGEALFREPVDEEVVFAEGDVEAARTFDDEASFVWGNAEAVL